MPRIIPLRVTLINPPPGVAILQQSGKDDLAPPSSESAEHLSFDFEVTIANEPSGSVPPNLRGPFVQGPSGARFTYINSGTYAGDHRSCWGRRAKIPLSGISWDQIEAVLAKPDRILEARVQGTGKDGGPVCASVPLIDGQWKLVKR